MSYPFSKTLDVPFDKAITRVPETLRREVCIENLKSDVVVMKSAKDHCYSDPDKLSAV